MAEAEKLDFRDLCRYIAQLNVVAKAGLRSAMTDCPKCNIGVLEAVQHIINCHGENGVVAVSTLTQELHQLPPAVSRSLRSLEQDGFVVRETDPADHRRTLVRMTERGSEVCDQYERAASDYVNSVLARLTPEQAQQMMQLRDAVLNAVLTENAARKVKMKGEADHDEDL